VTLSPAGPPADIEERLLLAIDGLAVTAIEATTDRCWRLYLVARSEASTVEAGLRETLGEALAAVRLVSVSDEAWAWRSQTALGAVRVGRVVVAPPWDQPPATAGEPSLVVVIEPSTGFGTGHHQSTRLCLAALQRLPIEGRSVLDVGTGSGVLAIVAARLGAQRVEAIDLDPEACNAARANVRRNGTEGQVRIARADLAALEGTSDIVLANLTADLLIAQAARLAALARRGDGRIVMSGIMTPQTPAVMEACADLELVSRDDEDDWVALTWRVP
jgi:ribosomal protein L11 methyltransferase